MDPCRYTIEEFAVADQIKSTVVCFLLTKGTNDTMHLRNNTIYTHCQVIRVISKMRANQTSGFLFIHISPYESAHSTCGVNPHFEPV